MSDFQSSIRVLYALTGRQLGWIRQFEGADAYAARLTPGEEYELRIEQDGQEPVVVNAVIKSAYANCRFVGVIRIERPPAKRAPPLDSPLK